jgi:hypothetical protein
VANRFRVGGPNSIFAQPGAEPARFWAGVWHGVISPATLIASFFTPDVRIYERNNRGVLYDLGFLLGVMIIFGGSKSKPRIKAPPPDEATTEEEELTTDSENKLETPPD